MRTRKPQSATDTPTEQRLRQVATALGLGRELPQAWVAARAGMPRSTLQNAGIRDRLSYELARKIARLMVGDEDKLIAWLRGEASEAPDGAEMAPRLPQAEPAGSGVGESAPVGLTAEQSRFMGLVRDALLGAVDRALARDHELEQTRRGYRILGDAFMDLGHQLEDNGVDTRELRRVARELQKMGQP